MSSLSHLDSLISGGGGIGLDTKPDPRMSIGSTGLRQFSGYIDEEFLARLRGRNGVKLYKEMSMNSPTLAAGLNLINWLIRGVDWRVEPADESDAAKAEAEDTEFALFEDMSHTFEDMVTEALSMNIYGWSYSEIVWKLRRGATDDPKTRSKKDDGKWGIRKVELRSQDTLRNWVFDDEGGIAGLIQQNPYGGFQGNSQPVFIPIAKALLFRTTQHKNNPEGQSLLRPAVIPYWYIKRIEGFEAIGIERELAGMPVMEVPFDMLIDNPPPGFAQVRQELEEFVTNVRRDERWGGLIPSSVKEDGTPSQFKFSLMSSGGSRQIDTSQIVTRHESRMLMLFIAQFLLFGMQMTAGNRSVAETMSALFSAGLNHLMDILASVLNRFLISRRQRLNGIPMELDPKLVHASAKPPNLKELGDYIRNITGAGITLQNSAKREILQSGGLPLPTDDELAEMEAKEEKAEAMRASAAAALNAATANGNGNGNDNDGGSGRTAPSDPADPDDDDDLDEAAAGA